MIRRKSQWPNRTNATICCFCSLKKDIPHRPLNGKSIEHPRNITMGVSGEKNQEKEGKMSFHYMSSCNIWKFCSGHAYLMKKLTKKILIWHRSEFFFSRIMIWSFYIHSKIFPLLLINFYIWIFGQDLDDGIN